MMVAMVVQQKVSMAQMPQGDPNVAKQQKIMMTFMPIFFGFIFYPMPSGLVLYWLTNTIAMSSYQKYLRGQQITAAPKSIR
jgi:YidC/Oxa1 family membrane protein insertase